MPGLTLSRRTKIIPSGVAAATLGPGGVAIDALWLKADALSLANNDRVSSWTDFSGLGNHAIQNAAPNKPAFVTGAVNSLPAVDFANPSTLILPNVMAGVAAATLLMVVKADADPNVSPNLGHPLLGWGSSGAVPYYPYLDGQIYDDWGTTARKTTGNPATPLTAWNIYEVVSAPGAWTNWLNGTQHFTTATNTVGWLSTLYIGGLSVFFNGLIAEICVYKSALSSGNRSLVRAALGTKYGITVV